MLTRLRTAFLLVAACATAFGGILVVPNSSATTPGNGPVTPKGNGLRLQEVVGNGQFYGPIVITGLRFRSAVGTGPVSFNSPSVKVTLSTTQVVSNTAGGGALPSVTYANNVGPDGTTVYNAALSASSPGCNGPAPCAFDIAIPFAAPFSYDPTKGRLLVDFVFSASSGTFTGSLDYVGFPDTIHSNALIVNGDPTQATGTLGIGGLVLGLDITAPVISSVVNAASGILPGLPNAGIAQGAIFVVYGSLLGPANISIASAAFQNTSLSGTSVAVTVNSTTVNALMYYTSAGQVAALLPSNTPTGGGTVKVTYNGQTSATAPIAVVANNLGIFTVDSSGGGPGIVTYPDYSLVSTSKAANCGGPSTTCGAANPGDTLILWATGLGPVSGNDASGAGLGVNMPNLPLKLWIGGIQAPVIYQGRSGCCIGEDQIVFTVPDNVPTGCAVPLLVEITTNITEISNNTIMPIAKGSRTCSLSAIGDAVNVAQLTGTIPIGDVELDHLLNGSSGFHDVGQFNFFTATVPAALQPFAGSYLDHLPVGACIAQNSSSRRGSSVVLTNLTPLDAGSSFTIKGPNGSMTVTAHSGDQPTLSAAGTLLVPGDYTITGTGGKDIGAFTANISIQPFPTITSPVSANNLTVSRSKGMTITWNGNGSTGHVEMDLSSSVDANTSATVTCTAPASAGTFTIPSYMLSALPNGTGTGFQFLPGDGPGGPASSTPFTATGLILGLAQTFIDGTPFGGFTIAN